MSWLQPSMPSPLSTAISVREATPNRLKPMEREMVLKFLWLLMVASFCFANYADYRACKERGERLQ